MMPPMVIQVKHKKSIAAYVKESEPFVCRMNGDAEMESERLLFSIWGMELAASVNCVG